RAVCDRLLNLNLQFEDVMRQSAESRDFALALDHGRSLECLGGARELEHQVRSGHALAGEHVVFAELLATQDVGLVAQLVDFARNELRLAGPACSDTAVVWECNALHE